ncbi:MAG: hypothetical protein WBZ48_02760 [Bacteroidota bacterium]
MAKEETEQNIQTKDRIGWGVKVPIISFQDAILFTKELCNMGGFDGTLDALSQVVGNTRSSSSFTAKLSALKNFFLLGTPDKESYSLTDLGRRIGSPTSSDDEKEAMVEALMKLDTIKTIFENYKGKVLPQREYLANAIVKLGVPPLIKTQWADYFIEATNFVGLILAREGGGYQLMSSPIKYANAIPAQSQPVIEPVDTSSLPPTQRAIELTQRKIDEEAMLRVPLAGGRYVLIPKDMTTKEAIYFSAWFQSWQDLQNQ